MRRKRFKPGDRAIFIGIPGAIPYEREVVIQTEMVPGHEGEPSFGEDGYWAQVPGYPCKSPKSLGGAWFIPARDLREKPLIAFELVAGIWAALVTAVLIYHVWFQ
jgi:hypothetical protein